jgi:N-acetylneuraminic acid mutarotase
MPTARDHLAAATLSGKVFVVGGRVGSMSRNLATAEAYDPAIDRWESRRPMPTPRGGIGVVALGGRLFVFGGEDPRQALGQTEAYDPAADRWVGMAAMPTPRHGLGTVVVARKVYVIGGGVKPGASRSSVNEVFDPGS